MEIPKEDEGLHTWVHSLDREVTALGMSNAALNSKIDAHDNTLQRIEASLDKLVDGFSKPKPPIQLLQAFAAIAAIVVAFGIFLELRLSPSELMTELLYNELATSTAITTSTLSARGGIIASATANIENITEKLMHLDEQHHLSQDRINALERVTSSLEAENDSSKQNELVRAIGAE